MSKINKSSRAVSSKKWIKLFIIIRIKMFKVISHVLLVLYWFTAQIES